ncbi:MAG: putative O-glycosylation ligase, exosortase A system-associated [Planctomycetes bacterium]|nr:putative O-glycosylation ligase, exosortase A system-associated [Planctomycetota bacterium]
MRDLIFASVILFLLPVVYRRPFIGLLVFSWLAYMRPQDLCWGFARPQRWSFLVAVVTMAGYFSRPRKEFYRRDLRCTILMALVVVVGLSVLAGREYSSDQFNRYVEFAKVVGVSLFTTTLVSTPERLRVLVWVIAMSFGFYGVKVGLGGVLSGGNMEVLRGPGGMLEDNNDFSLALCMSLPLLIHIGSSEKRPVLRRGVWMIVPLTILTVIMTRSRGGFLSLCICLAVITWRSRNRFLGFSLAGVAALVTFLVLPDSVFERLGTLQNVEQDGSAMGRIAAWKTAIRMASDNPVLGVGFQMFRRHYSEYASSAAEYVRVAHNSYLQVWAETGTISLCLYLFLIFYSLWRVWALRRDALRYFNTSWIINYATMFEAALCAFVLGSTFLNRFAFDLFYHYVGIIVAFEGIAYREMARLELRVPTDGGDPLTADIPVREERKRGFGRLVRKGGFRNRKLLPEGS